MEHLIDFSTVLDDIKEFGGKYARKGWNSQNQSIELQRPDENSKMTKPYFYINTVDGGKVPWLASQTDLLADDWYEVKENREGEM